MRFSLGQLNFDHATCEAVFVFFRDRIYKIKTNEKTEGWNEKPSIEDVSFLSWKKVIPFQHSALSNDNGL